VSRRVIRLQYADPTLVDMPVALDPTSSVLLKLTDASVTYPDGTVGLAPTTLGFAAGEFTVLLGPSGAGKSTMLRSLNGLVPLSAGSLHAAGLGKIERAADWRAHRRATGMVFQQHQLIGRLSVLRNVLTGRLAFNGTWRSMWPASVADRRIALNALDRVGLLDTALRRADQLSGGQQQRVGIARALAQQPRLVLADEPVASLDPATAARVLELLHGICRDSAIAVVVSLHQVELARRFADRVIGIAAGRVVYDGAPAALDDRALQRIYGAVPHTPAAPTDRSDPLDAGALPAPAA
jgi:phosphonate transport system ATP-binding protein